MTATPPPVGPDIHQWARSTRSYLQRWIGRLQWKTPQSSPSENGILLWDEVSKSPVVSWNNDFRRLAMTEVVFVHTPEDFPTPVSGVITLPGNTVYSICGTIDLLGDRIVCGANSVILGQSTATCTLQSTGLTGVALLTSAYTITLRHLTITAAIALALSGSAGQSLNWLAVNFTDCPSIGTIENYDNFIGLNLGIINSANMTFDGTIGTIGFGDTIFSGRAGETTIVVAPTANITRRFRAKFCAFVTPATGTGVDFSALASVPDEGYIYFKCNFGGSGTHLAGVQHDDNKGKFQGNSGISNSRYFANYYMTNNAVPTPVSVGVPTKALGTTTENPINERFSHSNNRATYTGANDRVFEVTGMGALSSNNNNVLRLYIAKNGAAVTTSFGEGTANAGGRAEGIVTASVVSLSTGDYIEVFVSDETVSNDITDINLNVIVSEL